MLQGASKVLQRARAGYGGGELHIASDARWKSGANAAYGRLPVGNVGAGTLYSIYHYVGPLTGELSELPADVPLLQEGLFAFDSKQDDGDKYASSTRKFRVLCRARMCECSTHICTPRHQPWVHTSLTTDGGPGLMWWGV